MKNKIINFIIDNRKRILPFSMVILCVNGMLLALWINQKQINKQKAVESIRQVTSDNIKNIEVVESVAVEATKQKALSQPVVKQETKTPVAKTIPSTLVSKSPVVAPKKTTIESAPAPTKNTMLDSISAVRKEKGLTIVKFNDLLNQAALAKSKDMYNQKYFAHTNPQGKKDFYFIEQVGYEYSSAGSNIAQGNFAGDKAVFDAWMASPGHKENILATFGREIGYASYNGYYTLLIAKPL
jgi:uncharacterized protein YkwD